jgi:hypothetical protein
MAAEGGVQMAAEAEGRSRSEAAAEAEKAEENALQQKQLLQMVATTETKW